MKVYRRTPCIVFAANLVRTRFLSRDVDKDQCLCLCVPDQAVDDMKEFSMCLSLHVFVCVPACTAPRLRQARPPAYRCVCKSAHQNPFYKYGSRDTKGGFSADVSASFAARAAATTWLSPCPVPPVSLVPVSVDPPSHPHKYSLGLWLLRAFRLHYEEDLTRALRTCIVLWEVEGEDGVSGNMRLEWRDTAENWR